MKPWSKGKKKAMRKSRLIHNRLKGDSSERLGESPVFGPRLRFLIEEQGLSIRQAAKRIGVAHPQLFRWLGQAHAPKQHTLERIARGLGCPATDLLPAGNQKVAATEPKILERVAELKTQLAASKNEQNRLRGLIRDLMNMSKSHKKDGKEPTDYQKLRLELYRVVHELEQEEITPHV